MEAPTPAAVPCRSAPPPVPSVTEDQAGTVAPTTTLFSVPPPLSVIPEEQIKELTADGRKLLYAKYGVTDWVEDLLQESFIALLERQRSGVDIQNLKAYYLKIVLNRDIDKIRRRQRWSRHHPQIPFDTGVVDNFQYQRDRNESDVERAAEDNATNLDIERVLAEMEADSKEAKFVPILRLRLKERSYAQIGLSLGIAKATAQSRGERGAIRFKQRLFELREGESNRS